MKKSNSMMSKLALARRKSIENVQVQRALRASKVQQAEFELGSSQFDMPPLNYSDEEEMAKRSSIGSPDKIEMSRQAALSKQALEVCRSAKMSSPMKIKMDLDSP